jgi:hypothetical protein
MPLSTSGFRRATSAWSTKPGVPGHTFGYQRLLEQPVTARGAPTTIRELLPKEIAGVCDAHDLPGDGCSHSGPTSTHI